ncbi:DUF3108 domain-containing protein [Rhodoligotrophos defluvii]|uniref:DUF3108 domain-containing protein n=1 Tax=Rhodoligotrophos defluvii TaxID=2561934 RepID=UPI00148558CB|nr:DUF3108 domain-containing protein [Rhodoligotrophos defluvii]
MAQAFSIVLQAGRLLRAGLLAAAPLMVAGATPAAAQAEKITLDFDVIAHGTRVYDIGVEYRLSREGYTAVLNAETTGLVGFFMDEQLQMQASGALTSSSAQPARFTYSQAEGKDRRTAQLRWTASRVEVERSYSLDEDRRRDLERAVEKTLPDPLSGVLNALLPSPGKVCAGSQRVYDGKEVFELSFSYLGTTQLQEKGSGYRGPVHQCRVQYKSIAGLSKKRAARNRANPPVYTVWFAPVHASSLGRDILVPVAASGEMKGRAVRIVAREATIDGKPLKSEARKPE